MRFIFRTAFGTMAFILFIAFGNLPCRGSDLGDCPIRNYPVSLPLPKGRLETSLEFRGDGKRILDLFHADASDGIKITDKWGGAVMANYGFSDRIDLHAEVTTSETNLNKGTIASDETLFSVKWNIYDRKYGVFPFTAIDFGLKWDTASTSGDHLADGKSNAATPFARITMGGMAGRYFPNFFAELRWTDIDTSWDDASADGAGDLRILEPNSDKTTVVLGMSLLIKFPFTTMAHLEYAYVKSFRSMSDAFHDESHVVRFDVSYFITEKLMLNIGQVYYRNYFSAQSNQFIDDSMGTGVNRNFLEMKIGLSYLFF